MKDLPFEIWSQIYSHLPPSQVSRLCGVNRAFFECAMSAKYRDLHVGGIIDEDLYVALANPAVSSRVHSISLDILNFKTFLLLSTEKFLPDKDVQFKQEGSLRLGRLRISTFHGADKQDLDRERFRVLKSLTISIGSVYHYVPFRQQPYLVRSAQRFWRSIGYSSLTSLDLSVPIEVYRDDLIPPDIHISTLCNLTLHIWSGYAATTDYRLQLSTKLAPFINRHSASLLRLSIIVEEAYFRSVPYYYSSSTLFEHVKALPRLEAFSIREPLLTPSQTDLAYLERFIRTHSRQLKELALHLLHSLHHDRWSLENDGGTPSVHKFTASDLEGLPLFDPTSISFPLLQKLDFAVFGDHTAPSEFPLALYLRLLRGTPKFPGSSLTHLTLRHNQLDSQDALTILRQFSTQTQPRSSTSILRPTVSHTTSFLVEVSISVAHLQPSFLRSLEEGLPRLRKLELDIWRFKLDEGPSAKTLRYTSSRAIIFLKDPAPIEDQLLQHTFREWDLRRLMITIRGFVERHGHVRREVLASVFPNVEELVYEMREIQMLSLE
ncbi:hypothetical protein DFP72DRAFT_65485 [Ephemerocybe angulata]|uniref:F-box domain-containing protein n=1 Tax=Ephemerocybe angulata TaxID=980116 RepID=A0A8H6HEH7_9AGAR|nr:hypothetical protein DFP72DRAFT_65485 [Tulosesus angulatus]